MLSFRKFLEIAVNSDMDFPSAFRSPRSSAAGVHRVDDPSHDIIPLTVFPNMFEPMRHMVDAGGRKHARAIGVFERVLEQLEKTHDGGPLMVNISNFEADDLIMMGKEIEKEAHNVMSSRMDSVKDEGTKWMAFANNLVKAVNDGMAAAAMSGKEQI